MIQANESISKHIQTAYQALDKAGHNFEKALWDLAYLKMGTVNPMEQNSDLHAMKQCGYQEMAQHLISNFREILNFEVEEVEPLDDDFLTNQILERHRVEDYR